MCTKAPSYLKQLGLPIVRAPQMPRELATGFGATIIIVICIIVNIQETCSIQDEIHAKVEQWKHGKQKFSREVAVCPLSDEHNLQWQAKHEFLSF